MQFTAIHDEWGRIDITLEDLGCGQAWEKIHRAPSVMLTCPECETGVAARVSKLGTRHLYHLARPEGCTLGAESLEHHLLKLELATCARKAGFVAELEVSGPSGAWRADVMVSSPDGWFMALEAQLSRVTAEEIQGRTLRYERDGVRVCWFGITPQPWTGCAPTLLVREPVERGQEWTVMAGMARLAEGAKDWSPVMVGLADAVNWMLTGRLVPHQPSFGSRRVTDREGGPWADGWVRSRRDSWKGWWTAPRYAAQDVERFRVEEISRRRRILQHQREQEQKAVKARAYLEFWDRTGAQVGWSRFRFMAERLLGQGIVFTAPSPHHGNGRPVYMVDQGRWTLVAVALPDPGLVGRWAEGLSILVDTQGLYYRLAASPSVSFRVYVLEVLSGQILKGDVVPLQAASSVSWPGASISFSGVGVLGFFRLYF